MASETERPENESDPLSQEDHGIGEPETGNPGFGDEDQGEPVFSVDEPVFPADEPVFSEELSYRPPEEPVAAASDVQPDAPAAPPPPVDPGQDEYHWFSAPAGQEEATPTPRRLGRTGPVWLVAAAGIVVVAIVWLFLANRGTPTDETAQSTNVPPTAAAVEAVAVEDTPTPAPPTPTPGPVQFAVGTKLVVGDTAGDGIRLRNAPGLGGITLAIIEDGTPFTVLDAGSEQESYPVEADGYVWYRLRATGGEDEGLVGWAAGDFFVIQE